MPEPKNFATRYGRFSDDGQEYIIERPDTPTPWVNVICPGDYGVVVSQAGGGYSWRTHASLNRITRWEQDLLRDDWGKFLYVRDERSGAFWSAAWKPVCAKPEEYECRHGTGYTVIRSIHSGIQTEWTIFVPPDASTEVWILTVSNRTRRTRALTLWSYLEWCLGESPDSHREFHKTFLETRTDARQANLFARKRLWGIPNAKGQNWNRSWEGVAWHGLGAPSRGACGSKRAFLGQYGSVASPLAVRAGAYQGPTTGKWDDAIASLCTRLTLPPGRSRTVVWTVGTAPTAREASAVARKYGRPAAARAALKATKEFWARTLEGTVVSTSDRAFDLLANHWLKYQAISGRIWGRTGYYQSGGAFGYRDQLQDSQIFLQSSPRSTRNQLLLHAGRQFPEGIVQHWWHPITGQGLTSRYSDDLLWLPFMTVRYLKETADYAVLREKRPFLPGASGKRSCAPATLYEHCLRSIRCALRRRSARGLPLIGEGDWNDGLSAAGWDGKGESVWVGQFLYGILTEFADLIPRAIRAGCISSGEKARAGKFLREAASLGRAVNRWGWDGKWYWAASMDDGDLIGSRTSRQGKIHLNPQTWSVLNGLVPSGRLKPMLRSVERQLYREYGPLVLHPAYREEDERIGYLTRYAPGVRENGGLYTHAGVWAVQMECLLKRHEKAWELWRSFCPIYRGADPDLYQCEPYVTPGNVDGPDSPLFGRGGWTWYTGSAAWLHNIMTEWILGVRPVWEGLLIDPCLPAHWDGFRMRRTYRGHTLDIRVRKARSDATVVESITMDGKPLKGNVIKVRGKPASHRIVATLQ